MINKLREQINSVFVGKSEVVDDVLVCLLAGGHVLLEDVPGVGKTTLAKALAHLAGGSFARIQFTPDTMPTDVTGLSVYNTKTGEFEYRPGAVMHNFLLADEINRTSPKTQSSLLEAMAEGQVTVDTKKLPLPDPFMVIATQNPVEFSGTYPLPEAQLDRFMMRLSIGYPDKEDELLLTRNVLSDTTQKMPDPVCSLSELAKARKAAAEVSISDGVLSYIRDICALTREEESFVTGASPRATIHLAMASRAHAALCGRDFVKPDDVKAVCNKVLSHRLALTPQAKIRQAKTEALLKSLIVRVNVPLE